MKRLITLPACVLGLALTLAACGTTTTPPTTTPDGTVITQPIGSNLSATVAQAITLGTGSQSAEVRISGSTATTATVQVVSVPTGLSVTPGTPKGLSTGEISIPLTFSGTAASGSMVKLSVVVGSATATVEVPVFSFNTLPITAPGLQSDYQAASIRFMADGSALLSSRLGAGSASVEVRNLLHITPTGTAFDLVSWPITRAGESISSVAVSTDGTIWVTVHGMTTKGGYLLARDTAGKVTTYWADAPGDKVNNATLTPDNRVWFTTYNNAALKSLTPVSSEVKAYSVPEKLDSLTLSSDGKLYYASFYANPAIIQFDPTTEKTQTFAVGIAGRSLPDKLAAGPDGSIWFIEARTATVWQLNPTTGKQAQFPLPSGAHPSEVAVSAAGQVWVADAANALLYTTFTTSTGMKAVAGVSAPLSGTVADGPMALRISPEGKPWYVAAGQLVRGQ